MRGEPGRFVDVAGMLGMLGMLGVYDLSGSFWGGEEWHCELLEGQFIADRSRQVGG